VEAQNLHDKFDTQKLKLRPVVHFYSFATFEVFTAVNIQVLVFWVVTTCGVVIEYQHFWGLAASIFRVNSHSCECSSEEWGGNGLHIMHYKVG
jgi:hypothetical protein